jgi:hypothetical protein
MEETYSIETSVDLQCFAWRYILEYVTLRCSSTSFFRTECSALGLLFLLERASEFHTRMHSFVEPVASGKVRGCMDTACTD